MVLKHPREREQVMLGITERVHMDHGNHGNVYITINFDDDGHPFDLLVREARIGGCDAANQEAIGRLVSLALRCGVDPNEIVDTLSGITCCPIWDGEILIHSVPDAIAQVLERNKNGAQPMEGRSVVQAGLRV